MNISDLIQRDPLTLNLTSLTNQLLTHIPPSSPFRPRVVNALTARPSTRTQLLDEVAAILAEPAFTLVVAKLYRPILLDLAARWVYGLENTVDRDQSEKQLHALALLIEVHIELYPILYRFLTSPTFKGGPLNVLLTHPTLITRERLHRLLLTTLRILNINRDLPNLLLWDLTSASTVIWHGHSDAPVNSNLENGHLPAEAVDNAARLLAIRCYAYQSGMGEEEREKVETQIFGEIYGPDCLLDYGEEVFFENGTPQIRKNNTDGWILPVTEVERIREARVKIADTSVDDQYYASQEGEHTFSIGQNELCSTIANIHGVLLVRTAPLDHSSRITDSGLIETPTAITSLQELALHLSLRVPTLVTSPPSSGKSLLISHLYSVLHPVHVSQPPPSNPVITIHLSDTSLDARSLLGAYTSSTRTPGQFEFKDGILVRAMKQGRWVVFEDLDKASSEVLGMVVKPLAESMRKDSDGWVGQRASLDQLGRGRVVAHDNFRLFATRSVPDGRIQEPTFLGANKWCEVRVGRPKKDEVEMIIQKKFAKLGTEVVRSVVQLWEDVKNIPNLGANALEIGLRDLERFCRRLERILPPVATSAADAMDVDMDSSVVSLGNLFTNPVLQEDLYLAAREVFFPFYLPSTVSTAMGASSSQQAYYKAIADLIARHLNLSEERRDWILLGKVPEYDVDKDLSTSGGGRVRGVRIGRTYLSSMPSKKIMASHASEKRPFALHKPALTLLSRLATSIALSEPLLLTGETGTGKTSVITYLASQLSIPLISLNLSHQTEASDLIGGMKPIDIRVRAAEIQENWRALFKSSFSQGKNEKFVGEVEDGVRLGKWKRVAGLWRESARRGIERCKQRQQKREEPGSTEAPRKRRKTEGEDGPGKDKVTERDWQNLVQEVDEFDVQHIQGKGKFAFAFVEGPLVRALRNGDWVLLDEINLASPETLECISSLLQSPTSSITLTEQTSSLTPIPRHPNFRLFACMNPATDVGKKDLPPNIRSRFTEIYVPPPDADKETLVSIVEGYLGPYAVGDRGAIMDVAEFYLGVKDLEQKRELADGGSNKRPHFSMRTLARALTFVQDAVGTSGFGFPLRRAIWEGCLMAFTMVLERERGSTEKVVRLAQKWLLNGVKNPKSLLSKQPPVPTGRRSEEFVQFGPFFLEKGPLYEGKEGEEDAMGDYVLTPSVERKLIDLARIVLTRRVPVLIEGPTSAGKTSSVEYLARRTGHRFIRINNHEHTDIQEYIGSYVSGAVTGKLVFKDGLLVQALRQGDWIVLDELNLAPTDVLEALNRLLDDNRELVIPETQEVVRPHPHFMLFATQNPPGLYAGRKVLSRAFRNRFLEVHFEDVPQDELETILCQRCRIAPSYGKKIVSVFHELQKRRQSSRVFESKQGFATLRDLFRWAGRDAVGYQELAENGYMLIAERTRRADDKAVVKEVIESVMNVKIDEGAMYKIHDNPAINVTSYLDCPLPSVSDLVWTSAMQRLFTLVARALKFNEPILLVGETGCGKTSVCQVYAAARGQDLHALNCHQNTETADLIGGLRPVRNRATREAELLQEASHSFRALGLEDVPMSVSDILIVINSLIKKDGALPENGLKAANELKDRAIQLQSIFEWHDGPLVEAMRNGDVFLLDEISLADDSVLERLNSVLEPGRSIVLAEKGGADDLSHHALQAQANFKLVATMNPGGDYGKKELSPALRNRFTEIWVPRVEDHQDLELIVGSLWKHDNLQQFTSPVLNFTNWLCSRVAEPTLFSLRDLLAWVNFMNSSWVPDDSSGLSAELLFHHAAHMTLLDGLSSLPQLSAYTKESLREIQNDAASKLMELVPVDKVTLFAPPHGPTPTNVIRIGSFSLSKRPKEVVEHIFNLQAPTTQDNAMRVIRACQVSKPILLEGSPGVGKTSLVAAIANLAGQELCRINLSDQTDLIDLFGSDLPIEGGATGEFAWKDAEFLKALQEGHWVLLDEMNLAPQAVLEGLNAVLDHRGTVFIPELGRSFTRHPNFRIFAAQNPLSQGGGRKGLPKSFVNRFTKVYVEELTPSDLLLVCRLIFPELAKDVVEAMVSYNMRLHDSIVHQRLFAKDGGPWEFNLRDIIRWGHLLRASTDSTIHPINHLRTIYLHRFRNLEDQKHARQLFDNVFSTSAIHIPPHSLTITSSYLQIGHCHLHRQNFNPFYAAKRVLKMQLPILEALAYCLPQHWLAILTGHKNSGKTDSVRTLAHLMGHSLREVSINSATDTMDLLGSFEQVDAEGRGMALVEETLRVVEDITRTGSATKFPCSLLIKLRQAQQHPAMMLEALNVVAAMREELQDLPTLVSIVGKIQTFLASSFSSGYFEWVDGPLVQAIKSGHWLLMDGANLCNPSVLDRLNSLCEEGGTLTLSERGYVDGTIQTLQPHPNFRLFMTVDPQYGELSRAMRNRGVEISMVTPPTQDDSSILLDCQRLPATNIPHSGRRACVVFETTRRAVNLNPYSAQVLDTSTTGRLLQQDSALSSLLDQAPAIVMSLKPFDAPLDALIFFFGRTLSPNVLQPFVRYAAHHASLQVPHLATFLAFLGESSTSSLRSKLREIFSIRTSVPSNLSLAQPFDFYLSSPACIVENNLSANKANHHAVLEALDLATVLFLTQENRRSYPSPQRNGLNVGPQDIIRAAESFLNGLEDFSREILGALCTGHPVTSDVSVISSFSKYSQDLRRVLCNEPLDFSAFQAVFRLLNTIFEDTEQVPETIRASFKVLRNAAALQEGVGLFDIWTRSYVDPKAGYITKRYDDAPNSVKTPASRRRILDLLSLSTLPAQISEIDRANIKVLEDEILQSQTSPEIKHSEHVADNDAITLIAGLSILPTVVASPGDALGSLNETIKLIIYMGGPLSRAVRLQHLVWEIEAGQDCAPTWIRAQLDWLMSVWTISNPSNKISPGPSNLLSPYALLSTLNICNSTELLLLDSQTIKSDLLEQARAVRLLAERPTSRTEQLRALLQASIRILVESFVEVREVKVGHSAGDLLDLFMESGRVQIGDAFSQYLGTIKPAPASREMAISEMSQRWVDLGKLIASLFIPDRPVDPLAVEGFVIQHRQNACKSLLLQKHLHLELEKLTSGSGTNGCIQYLDSQPEIITQADPLDTLGHSGRRDPQRVRSFWAEVNQFKDQIVMSDKLSTLLASLQNGDTTCISQEETIQQSMAGFLQRLDSVYGDLEDLVTPVKLSISYLRLGLRLAAYQALQHEGMSSAASARAVATLSSYPLIVSASGICEDSGQINISPFRRLLISLSAINVERSTTYRNDTRLDLVETVYEQAHRLWHIDLAKKSEADMAANSLYRRNKADYEDMGDAELEEKEFLALFPSFEDVFENPRLASSPSSEAKPLVQVSVSDAEALVRHHYQLLSSKRFSSEPLTTFLEERASTLEAILSSHPVSLPVSLPDELDHVSFHHQITTIHRKVQLIERDPSHSTTSYNFYQDANVPELRKALTVVSTLRSRLITIIEEWPDQMVLHHLRDKCDFILQLRLHSPIAQVLAALEQLLLQSEDWEMYANRDNTIKPHQQTLIQLIVSWRRLELTCWRSLLDSQAYSYEMEVTSWWFRLYDVTVRGPTDAFLSGDPNAITDYLQNLVPLLDEYLRTSSMGQFEARLRLLQSFEQYIHLVREHRDPSQQVLLLRIERILGSTRKAYEISSTTIAAHLSKQRSQLEKEIRDFIKLASWKDVNVQALKASAQRTHHQLYKTVRKFREVLRQPASSLLVSPTTDTTDATPLVGPSITPLPRTPQSYGSAVPPEVKVHYSGDLSRTIDRFGAVVISKIHVAIAHKTARVVDDLAVSIIVTADNLANISIPRGIDKEARRKQQKALLVRKRKAWSDLLKELKRAGFAANVKSEVLRRNADPVWLRDQPSMVVPSKAQLDGDKCEAYHYRLQSALPQLRGALSDHHPDISTRELHRGQMFVESAFAYAMDIRASLAHSLNYFHTLVRTSERLSILLKTDLHPFHGEQLGGHAHMIQNTLAQTTGALGDLLDTLIAYNTLQPETYVPDTAIAQVEALKHETATMRDRICHLMDGIFATSQPFLTVEEECMFAASVKYLSTLSAKLTNLGKHHPTVDRLVAPVSKWLDALPIPNIAAVNGDTHPSPVSLDPIINGLLITVQNILKRCPPTDVNRPVDQEEEDRYILQGFKSVSEITQAMDLPTVISLLDDALPFMLSDPAATRSKLLAIKPLLDTFLDMAQVQLASHLSWTTALFKLDFILTSIMRRLAREGFCQPPDSEETGDTGDGSEATNGMGLGEGSGTENVSKEIEDESQVEGLKGEDGGKEGQDKSDRDDKGTIEMSEDIDGELEDVSETEDEGEDESDNGSEIDPEEKIENLDPKDPNAIDEKLWGDEKGPEDGGENDEKLDQDRSEEKDGSSEVVGKDGQKKESKEKQKTNKEKEDDQSMEKEEDKTCPDMEEDADVPNADGAPMDEHVQDANTLDLPEDMDLGEELKQDDDDQALSEMEADDEREREQDMVEDFPEKSREEDNRTENWVQEDQPPEVEDEPMDEEDDPEHTDQPKEAADGQVDKETEEDKQDDDKQEATAKPDLSTDEGVNAPDDPNLDLGDSAAAGQSSGTQDTSGQPKAPIETQSADQQNSPQTVGQQPQDNPAQSVDSETAGAATSGAQEGQVPSQPDTSIKTNPLRSLGDALKEVRQRFDDILSSDQQAPPKEQLGDVANPSQLEYLQPDDADHDMQALGSAGEEQVAKLNDLKLIDEEERPGESAPMDIDMDMGEENVQQPAVSERFRQDDLTASEKRDDVEGAIQQISRQAASQPSLSSVSDELTHKVDSEALEELEHAAETSLREWQSQGFPEAGGEKIWRTYESLTHDLAYALCEQLRLILEPTLATRLKGDYRTGKRLNMKKIISYIASDYTKDKIWLRRTRPSQREYQVLISIDDSRSMAESHSIHLAFETLALVSKALSRLESGDIAIAKFGEGVDILHGFDEGPFTDQAGTKIMNAFHFNQKATNVLSLLETSLKVLEKARERRATSSSTAGDLWQIQFIISDGMCQDHEKLRTVLRKAEEQRVMVVFVILDSLHSTSGAPSTSNPDQKGVAQGSILTMDKAEFKNVNGRMELQLQKYLDSFPFEYYVVLRNVEALPEVLASTLKQFFERITEE